MSEKYLLSNGQIDPGTYISGTFYRGVGMFDEFKVRGRTAADIINYEWDELGNDDTARAFVIAKCRKIDLSKIPASSLLWITPRREVAEHYGDVRTIHLPKRALVLAADGDDGYLVLLSTKKNPEKKSRVWRIESTAILGFLITFITQLGQKCRTVFM